MKILDFTNKEFIEPIELGSNTAMVMCFTPKIVLFETSEELCKFYRVWEDVIQEYLEKHKELDPDYELDYYAGWFVAPFEEEWFFKLDVENKEPDAYEPRNLKIVSNKDASDEEYQPLYDIKLGILNSKDTCIDEETLEYHVKLVDMLFETEEMLDRLKDDTKKMFEDIQKVWKEELKAFKSPDRKYFKVKILGD